MDPLTLGGTVIGILAAVAGIVAAVVQVREYLEKRRKKPDGSAQEARPLALPSAPQIPHNLPPRREFVGREAEKARVHEALRSRYPLTSIDGIGGIGKTVLALEVVHECLRASKSGDSADDMATFDGFIWTTAKDRDLTLNALLDAVARTLDYPGIAQQPVEEKRDAVRKLLQEKPHLLIVDNFETITDEGVRDFLLELPEPSKALITTREQKLHQVWAISLKGLAEPEALALIHSAGRRLGLTALQHSEDRVLLHLYQATGGVPLAIKWAVGQIKQKGQSLDTVLEALHEARGDIFDCIFARSWNLLVEDARQVLMAMSLFATSVSREGIEAASDVHHFALDEALGQLVEMSLVEATDELDLARRRYGIHPLTRAFAAGKLQSGPKIDIYKRMLGHYIRAVTPPEEKQVGDPYWDGMANYAQSESLEPEWRNIEHLIHWALNNGDYVAAMDLFLPVVHFLHSWGLWDERLQMSREMCQAANRLGDPAEAWLWIDAIGYILHQRQQFSECFQALNKGRLLACQFDLDDASILVDVFEAFSYAEMGNIELARKKIEKVLEQVGLDTLLEHSTPVRRIVATRAVGTTAWLSRLQGDFVHQKEWYLYELELRRSTGQNVATTLGGLAHVSLKLDDIVSAEKYLAEASADAGKKDRPWIDYEWALVAEKKGEWSEARSLCTRALEQFARLGRGSGVQECRELLTRLSKLTDRMTP
jgi:tetratricopeptide (TPR) repeat protein